MNPTGATTPAFGRILARSAKSPSRIADVIQTNCPTCRGTGWAKVSRDGVQGVVRCDCYRESRQDRLFAGAKIPRRYEHCELDNFDIMPRHSPDRSIERAKVVAMKFVEEY